MSRRGFEGYRFATAEQWSACLFRAADRSAAKSQAGLHPQAPYSFEARVIESPGARAPTVTPAGEILWHDSTQLLRALPDQETAERLTAPWPIAQAGRLVSTHDSLWVAGASPGTLECFDARSLARQRVIELDGATVLDLAAAGRNTLLVLVARDAGDEPAREILRLDCGGSVNLLARLDADLDAAQVAVLPARELARLGVVLLDSRGRRLHGLTLAANPGPHAAAPEEPTAVWSLELGALHPCFTARWLASDGRTRVLLAGRDGADFGGTPYVLTVDSEGTPIGALQLTTPATGVAVGREFLVVSHEHGVAIHTRAAVAGDAAGVTAEAITPLLHAPHTEAEVLWQRVDAWGRLPVGTTLELRYGWIEDAATRDEALRFARDVRALPPQRFARLMHVIDHWSAPVNFAGSADSTNAAAAASYSFPLQDARAAQLWVHVTLRAAPRAELPALSRMVVSWGASPLLQQLPAIYRRTAVQPGDFLGALVGTFEATTQDLDRRIGSLGSLVHPDTAPIAWLDEVAEWLGLPWDDALTPAQKRALMRAAGPLAAQRGTRGGLETLLASLFPGQPRRFQVSDIDADFGFAALGGGRCIGSALPAVLAGLPRTATVLSRKTILGQARLPCQGHEPSATAWLSGNLRVDLTLSATERSASAAWLARLVEAMVPAHVRVAIRWHVPRGAGFDGMGELLPAPLAHLGADAITGVARLPDRGSGTLSS